MLVRLILNLLVFAGKCPIYVCITLCVITKTNGPKHVTLYHYVSKQPKNKSSTMSKFLISKDNYNTLEHTSNNSEA